MIGINGHLFMFQFCSSWICKPANQASTIKSSIKFMGTAPVVASNGERPHTGLCSTGSIVLTAHCTASLYRHYSVEIVDSAGRLCQLKIGCSADVVSVVHVAGYSSSSQVLPF